MIVRRDGSLPPGFEKFWAAYPRKEARGRAIKAWISKENNCEPIADAIVKAVKSYPFSPERGYIKLPATWLNAWCWEDTFDTGDNNVDWT
jgi:hypothetical protein